MTSPEVAQFGDYIRESFSRHGLPVDRCSRIFFSQLAHMPGYSGLNYPFQFVEREIRHLEGKGDTITKPAAAFNKSGPLRNFMHKHFCVAGYEHLGVNAKLAWKLDNPRSPKFFQMALRVAKPYKNRDLNEADSWKFAGELANEIVHGAGGLDDRLAGSATGDWIIYLPHHGQNYYLCIAEHDEDRFILDTIKHCAAEFPFVCAYVSP
jgi:hypothetical protein